MNRNRFCLLILAFALVSSALSQEMEFEIAINGEVPILAGETVIANEETVIVDEGAVIVVEEAVIVTEEAVIINEEEPIVVEDPPTTIQYELQGRISKFYVAESRLYFTISESIPYYPYRRESAYNFIEPRPDTLRMMFDMLMQVAQNGRTVAVKRNMYGHEIISETETHYSVENVICAFM